MPKRNDIHSILIIGSGPIIIGQACEFDYSGAQACTALKEEGYRVILINSNPATIMTDPNMADRTYIEPIDVKIITEIIKKEKPDAILPTMGGQTALNCALQLHRKGILKKYEVELIGVTIKSIQKAENRSSFEKSMQSINLNTAKCGIAHDLEEAKKVVQSIGFPCIIRPSFTMGGSGGGIAYNYEEFKNICLLGLEASPISELLIDESLIGWKEYELEVVRDISGNFIVICTIENIDPMGIHTGDSMTVAPAQTLSDKEYQNMRNAAIMILKEIGVTSGGSNVQFAVNPKSGKIIVIEMNPRVSRSSALASKATGFPIARISTKLSIGYTLDELRNNITGNNTPAAFEPSIDYIVTKIPRFDFKKFHECNDRLTTQMKSIGEVMAIGRTFQESLQKAIRSLEIGSTGFDINIQINKINNSTFLEKKIYYELKEAGPERLWYIGEAFRLNWSIEKIYQLTHIDPWFLNNIQDLILIEKKIVQKKLSDLNYKNLKYLKTKGFSDLRISQLINVQENDVRKKRYKLQLHPVYKRIDTCSAEFSTKTAYMYSTWEDECESLPTKNSKKIIILGSGPNRIGQGIEFDYCCVHASQILRKDKYETIMINCNPETVSTDYDVSDRLYFEPIALEEILEIIRIEKPMGIVIQYGGQTPLKLAKHLQKEKIKILGTQPKYIDISENRKKFQQVINRLKLKQPKNYTSNNVQQALKKSNKIGYPIIVRPSYVLGGREMEIIYNDNQLIEYFQHRDQKSKKQTILLDQYLDNATEIDVDAICDGKKVFIGGIMEHIEQAGIHSGDSACTLPVYTLDKKTEKKIEKQTKILAIELKVLGLINIQFAIKDKQIFILEVNPRASRTIPFVSKSLGIPLTKIAMRVICGNTLSQQKYTTKITPKFFSVKEVVLPFNKFPETNPVLGPEMRSTGEVMGLGKNFALAFYKAMLGISIHLKKTGIVLLSVQNKDKNSIVDIAIQLKKLKFSIEATQGTYAKLKSAGIQAKLVSKIYEGRPNIQDFIKNKKYTYIINTALDNKKNIETRKIRNMALKYKIHYDSTLNGAFATISTLKYIGKNTILCLQDIHYDKF
ncbi:Carbamoyl-phosphate synthase large chain [Buchnera aphidicola (Cinara pseudotaxifoliae)]|uniref:Carbamoyl phosphate synthase large chain n=1 Tax=Buchnera aphidicola (Cinara pseudotaxifoliae) TaxID=655384 RepID=A0A451DGH3_9GAMM|nr:carbamoyl-phosphate synthase large subunit [Buchnera aphidicola]VFP85714.1 Carbamoyl-phosphate synthase large chain [Buchnera aphidicola (Cinara pseudotaxifoliae)]